MAGLKPSVIITGHGELASGVEAIEDELTTLAKYLRHIVDHALRGLNSGVLADEIVETLQIPEELANHPRLPAVYDKPQFICRNVIRRYAGWWDGYPANLLPAPRAEQAAEIAGLAGGVDAIVERAWALAEENLRLACHLAEWAFLADRSNERAQDAYQQILERRAKEEPALMAQVNLRVSSQWVQKARSTAGEKVQG
jgi:alkyl sulfatase BDS1-like metallo-beta-lactamase superfamily hydrolase